jgi:mono/diheme cytochrome c family protein
MRFFVVFMLVVSAALLPQLAIAEKANTIDELVSPIDSSQCEGCHADFHENWSKSWHAKSITDPRTIRSFRTFLLSGVDKLPGVKRTMLRDMCLMCHAPIAFSNASDELAEQIAGLVVTAVDDKDASKRDAALKELSKVDINCLTCHGNKTPGGLGAGQLEANTIYGPGKAANPPHKDAIGFNTIASPYMTKAEFCAPCHHGCPPGVSSKECPTQWSAYQEEYLAHGGKKTCQECHMAAEGGESHRFPGLYEKDFAKSVIDLKLSATPTRMFDHLNNTSSPGFVMNVQLKNDGPHGIPHG